MTDKIKELIARYPLSTRWSSPECFEDKLELDGLSFKLCGLSCESRDGLQVTGSAVEAATSPATRCFFELLERTSIIECESRAGEAFKLHSGTGEYHCDITHEELFPQSPEPTVWRYAKSNGVAAHLDRMAACRMASLELIERDRILRSWYGHLLPIKTALPAGSLARNLKKHYEFECYEFPDTAGLYEKMHVAAVFGFPTSLNIPPVRGFAARESREEALAAAERECLQALAFLWGEALPESFPPTPSPTPDCHQEYFLSAAGTERLKRWLRGSHFRPGPVKRRDSPILFVEVTPSQLVGKVAVVKAVSADFLPLTFGACPLHAPEGFPPEWLIHPIS